jgi:hypothetical protein
MQSYIVRRGDSLSVLAERFGIPLAALVRVNRKQANPHLIRDGEVLRIPRPRSKYDELVASLQNLLAEANSDHRQRMAELGGIEHEGAVYGGRIDLVADVTTCFIGMGKAALTYGGIVRNAALRKGTFDAVQKVLVHAATGEGVSNGGTITLKAAGKVQADQYLRLYENVGTFDSQRAAGKFGKDVGKGVSKAAAKHLIKSHITVDKQTSTELAVTIAMQAVFTGFKKAGDIAGAISPSSLAQFYLRYGNGEDLRMTLAQSRQAVIASHQRITRMLNERIAATRAEYGEAYP